MKYLATLALAGICLFPTQAISQTTTTETITKTSTWKTKGFQQIANFFSQQNYRAEHSVVYSVEKETVKDMSQQSAAMSVRPNWVEMENLGSGTLIFSHNHPIGARDYLRNVRVTQEALEHILQMDPALVDKRLLLAKVPSPGEGFSGDIISLMNKECILENDIIHTITIINPHYAPRIIEYGLSKESMKEFNDTCERYHTTCNKLKKVRDQGDDSMPLDVALQECTDAIAQKKETTKELSSRYNGLWYNYFRNVLSIESKREGKEPNMKEFIEKVNNEGTFFLKYWGEYKVDKK